MKTNEEIVQLINTFWFKYRYDNGYKLTGSLTHMGEKDMLVKLYTQCQEDNKDKKYTEEDLHTILKLRREWYSHTDKNVVRDFINSLNKQN
jgi:hypothetical protein